MHPPIPIKTGPLLLLVLLAGCAHAPTPCERAAQLYQEGLALIRANRVNEAQAKFQEHITQEELNQCGQDTAAQKAQSRQMYEQGEYALRHDRADLAITLWRKALELDKGNDKAREALKKQNIY